MRELGITFVRIAEFAWARYEPRRGEFEWAWLDDAIDSIAAEGLQVVLCTPTAAPPAWLIREHPEILPAGSDGAPRQFGARRHYDFASPVYREEAERIVTVLANRYGQHPAVAGWQIDNEFGDHETGVSFGPASRAAFRTWLQRRYDSIDDLNDAWGNVFWSQEYRAWSEIDPPNLTVAEPNPSHVLDYRRFSSDMVTEFSDLQVDIVRRLSPGRWITHNYMRLCPEFDHYVNARAFDFVTFDVYPSGAVEFSPFDEAEKTRWARGGHPDIVAFNHDLYRGMKNGRPHWVMEGQVGHINWAPSNPLPAQGAVSLWTAQAFAHGASCMSFFRWRAATAAQEIMHSGILRHDESLDRGGQEIAALDLTGHPVAAVTPKVVLLHDYESLWIYDEQPHSQNASYWEQVMLFYSALRGLGVDVDIRHPDHDLTEYAVIVAPAIQIVGEERASRWSTLATDRPFVFGPRTAFRTPSGRVHEDGQPGPLRGLLGLSLMNFDGMRPGLTCSAGGHRVETWAESYRPLDGEVLIRYDENTPLAGHAAVIRNGNATTIGAWSPSLIEQTLGSVLKRAGIATRRMQEGVRRSQIGSDEIWLNFNQQPVDIEPGFEVRATSYRIRPGVS